MGFLSCNAESAIATCDSDNWNLIKKNSQTKTKTKNKSHSLKSLTHFSYSDLHLSTNGFSQSHFLGKGSHGSVYKAHLDFHNRHLIAAVKITKQTEPASTNGSTTFAENEIEVLSRIRYSRLVNLLGFSLDPKKNRLLVVEYMPNGSLFDLLHGSTRIPGWTRRVRFALQIAKAVHFLHSSNPPVIHRDIKSSNVLIDGNHNARLSDFGLALRGHAEDVRAKCTPPAGTLGYLDPGYLAPGDLSPKSDVFSFGILLLEIISGRNAIDVNYSPPSVVDWAVPVIKSGEYTDIFDSRISPPEDDVIIRQLAVLAAWCVKPSPAKRPTMAEVVESLKSVYKRLKLPIWNQIGRRVDCVRESTRVVQYKPLDESSKMVRTARSGSRRNRKVSNVGSVERERGDLIGGKGFDRIGRSRSIGSFREIDFGSLDIRDDIIEVGFGRSRVGSAVKMPTVRMSKSMSLGRLQGSRLLNSESGVPVKLVKAPKFMEFDESKLLLKLV